jgi:hypothetical protein
MIATTHRQDTRRHRWWSGRHAPLRSTPAQPAPFRYDRPADVLAVLQHARAIVEAGWVQNRWIATRPAPDVQGSPAGAGTDDAGTGGGAVSACVVAAVALAVRARDPRADLAVATGPAVAAVWDAVDAGRGARRASGRAAPHAVRVTRMRELARWNDEHGRTRSDVVAALDRAAALVVATTVDPARV